MWVGPESSHWFLDSSIIKHRVVAPEQEYGDVCYPNVRALCNIMVEPSGWSSGNAVDICIHDIITFSVGFNYNRWIRSFHQNEQEAKERQDVKSQESQQAF